MSAKSKSWTPTLDDQLEALITAANDDLDCERERILREFRKLHAQGGYSDAFSPGVARLIHRLPSSLSNGATTGAFASIYATNWTAGFIAFAYQLLVGLPEVYKASTSERHGKLVAVTMNAVGAAAAAGMAAYAVDKLKTFFMRNMSRFWSAICNKNAAESFISKMLGEGLTLSATAGTLASASFKALTAFHYAAKSAWAKYNGDSASSNEEWEKMWKVLSLDNCLRTAVSASGGVLACLLAPVIGTGYFAFLIPVVLYFLCEWILEIVIARKEDHGGWSRWFASWFMQDQSRKAWAGGDLDKFIDHFPEDILCYISHELVIDPIRSIRTGHVYERSQLYDWLDLRHTDPLTGEKAFSIDYIDSPCAAKHAERIAKLLGANQVSVNVQL